jgi:hypothetical protein
VPKPHPIPDPRAYLSLSEGTITAISLINLSDVPDNKSALFPRRVPISDEP